MDLLNVWISYWHQVMTSIEFHVIIIILLAIQKYLMMIKRVEMIQLLFFAKWFEFKINANFCARMCIIVVIRVLNTSCVEGSASIVWMVSHFFGIGDVYMWCGLVRLMLFVHEC